MARRHVVVMGREELEAFRMSFLERCQPPQYPVLVRPVQPETVQEWTRWLAKQATLPAPPAMPPRGYYKLCQLVMALWEQNRDQATAIQGLKDHYAIAKKTARQEELL